VGINRSDFKTRKPEKNYMVSWLPDSNPENLIRAIRASLPSLRSE
jgi:hypothetical protein